MSATAIDTTPYLRRIGRAMDDSLLLALGELIRKEINAGQLLRHIVDVMAARLDADRGTLYLLDEQRDELVSVAAHLPELTELRVPISQGIAGFVARSGELVNLPDDSHKTQQLFWSRVDQRTGYTTRSMLTAPLLDSQERVIGVVQMLNKHGGEAFDERDIERCIKLARDAAALLEETTLRDGRDYLDPQPDEQVGEPPMLGERFNQIIGHGEAMRRVFRDIRRVAPTDAVVLLRGESGTGKTLVARALHHNSSRSDGPFVHLDCTTLPESLIENELFGHEKGAFTGADSRKMGRVEAANTGTLFLDEIGEMPPALQAKLLTLLQDRSFSRVGSTERQQADIRIVAATNRPLEKLVDEGEFREDLYYRLRVVQIAMPPLRDRSREDLLQLINFFVDRAAKRHDRPVSRIRQDALEMLLDYHWPGNVRELENCMESAVIFSDAIITPSSIPLPRPNTTRKLKSLKLQLQDAARLESLTPQRSPNPNAVFTDEPSLRELEARYIAYLLEQHDNNRSQCARILDIGRNTLLRKIRDYGLDD